MVPDLMRAFSSTFSAETRTVKTVDNGLMVELSGGSLPDQASFKIGPSTSADGIATLLDGGAEVALSDRRALTREVRAAGELDLGDLQSRTQEQIIALDGLVFVTHPRNPIRAVSQGDAAVIFAGLITNWSEVGGSNAPINLYVSTADGGATEMFQALVMRPAGLTIQQNAKVLGSDRLVAEAVAADPNGIGYTRFSGTGAARPLAIRGDCGIQTQPSDFAIKTEEYPLTRLLYMYLTNKDISPITNQLITFLGTDLAQATVTSSGFIDQSISSASIDQQGLRLASAMMMASDADAQRELREMMDSLLSAERLSATFRYQTGTPDLNARAQADLDRLAAALSSGRFEGKEVLFLGFTDSIGDAELNRQLSQQRAEEVIEILVTAYPDLANKVRLTAVGYGELSPLACNELDGGRAINRRIEVWVRDYVR
ncbi:MAG: OmpA family protein [Tabrizicola sp.]|nr:OmpA family protein [Tabrizicola sp.]